MPRLLNIAPPGQRSAAAGFDTPMAMLKECHRRVQDQCDTLARLVPHLARHGSDTAAVEAAAAVVRYFEVAAPQHHADEEDELLPAMFEAVAGADAVCLHEMAAGLLADHEALAAQWHTLRAVLVDIMAGKPARLDGAAVQAFAQHYRAHIRFEEEALFPMAERLLAQEVLAQMGRAMRRRRGEG